MLERIRYGTQLITIEMAYDNDVFESALDQCGSSSLRGVLGFSLMATCMSVVKLSWDKQEFQYPEQMIADTSCTLDVDLSDWGLVQDVGEGVTLVSRDLKQKLAIAHDVITRYRSQLFCNRGLPLKTKMQLFDSLVVKAITFSSATWQPRTPKQWRQLHAGFLRLYERVCICHFGKEALDWSASKVRAILEVPSAATVLRTARLRYFAQLVRSGQAHTWGLIQCEQTWYEQVCVDLAWLQRQCPEDEIPDGSPDAWNQLKDRLQNSPDQWKRIIRKAMKRDIAYYRRKHDWEEWHSWIHGYLVEAGAISMKRHAAKSSQHFCLACHKQFPSAAAQSVHSLKMHDRRQAARYFVTKEQCIACLKQYNSHVNLLKRSTQCFRRYLEPMLLEGSTVEMQIGSSRTQLIRTCKPRDRVCRKSFHVLKTHIYLVKRPSYGRVGRGSSSNLCKIRNSPQRTYERRLLKPT